MSDREAEECDVWLKKRKRIEQRTAMHVLFYMANDERFVKTLTEEQRLILINHVKDSRIDSCLCYPCFAWTFDEGCTKTEYKCTLGGKPKIKEKGECPDA